MINISNIIIQIQRILSEEPDSLTALTLAKSIEKLEVGNINVVSTISDLPTLPLSSDGEVYLVEDDADLYHNTGNVWYYLPVLYNNTPYSWGRGTFGQLGVNSVASKSSPVTVLGGITNWTQVSAGIEHSLGISGGIAYAWGRNIDGRLGDGTIVDRFSPVTVVGGITNWSQISAGSNHSLGVTKDGVAYGWGGGYGPVGDNTIVAKSSPVTVVGGLTWSQISAGGTHSLGVTNNGVAYAWGRNATGQIGDGTTVNKSSPVLVIGDITNWSQISAGDDDHSLGIASGVAYAWGDNSNGRLGDGTTVNKSSPVLVIGDITNWTQLSAARTHSLGIAGGIAYAWGDNSNGRLGDGTTINKSSPVTVVGGITNWSQVSGGFGHSLGVTDTGVAYAWGAGSSGTLGDNSIVDKSSPVTVVGGITNWSQVSAGAFFTIAFSSTKETL